MADIAGILSGLLGGVGQGIGNIQDTRRQQQQLQLQQQQQLQQAKQHQERLEFEKLKEAYGTLTPDVDIDPMQAQKFVSNGFSLGKGPTGMARRLPTIAETNAMKAGKSSDLELEINQEKLSESRKSRAFRESLSNEQSMQSLMGRPLTERRAIWSAMNMSGDVPMTMEETGQEDLAKVRGDLAVQGLQNQGYAAVAGQRQNMNMQETYPQFEAWFNSQLATDPGFAKEFTAARQDADPTAVNRFKEFAFQRFRTFGGVGFK